VPKKNPDKKKKKDAPTGKVEAAPDVGEGTTLEARAADVTITPADATTTGQPAATVTGTIGKIPISVIDRPILNLPIFLNTSPGIGSLAPSSVQVGSGDLPLTVLGSNFGAGSSVLWNGTALANPTVVSSTQINVAVPAADLAAPGVVNVVVQNPPAAAGGTPVSSTSAQFTIFPSWTDIQTQLKTLSPTLEQYVVAYTGLLNDTISTQGNTIQNDASSYNALNVQYTNDEGTISQLKAQVNSLTSQLAAATFQTASPLDVASSFKTVVDQIQQAAQSAGGVQTTVTNMNVQVKSLLSVQGATSTAPASASLIFPAPTALPDPQHLSTLSFTFGSIPNLKTAAAASAPPTTPPLSSSSSSSSGSSAPPPASPSSSSSSSASGTAAPSVAQPRSTAASRVLVENTPASSSSARVSAARKTPKKG